MVESSCVAGNSMMTMMMMGWSLNWCRCYNNGWARKTLSYYMQLWICQSNTGQYQNGKFWKRAASSERPAMNVEVIGHQGSITKCGESKRQDRMAQGSLISKVRNHVHLCSECGHPGMQGFRSAGDAGQRQSTLGLQVTTAVQPLCATAGCKKKQANVETEACALLAAAVQTVSWWWWWCSWLWWLFASLSWLVVEWCWCRCGVGGGQKCGEVGRMMTKVVQRPANEPVAG